jgi:hypothetical protein
MDAGWIQQDVNSQYIAHVGLRYAHAFHRSLIGAGFFTALRIAGYVVTALNLAIVTWLEHRKSHNAAALSMVAILLIQPFLLRTSWPHYFCYLPVCQAILLCELLMRPMGGLLRGVLFGSVSLSVLGSSMLLFNLVGDWNTYSFYAVLFMANLCLFPPLYVLALRGSPSAGDRNPRPVSAAA